MKENAYYFFLRHFFRNPKTVGALAPFSQRVAYQLIKELHLRQAGAWRILEVGAGTGNVTEAIIAAMNADDVLDLVEIDEECCHLLERKFGHDPRIRVHCLSIVDWKPNYQYDFIVSTLPLNSFSHKFVEKVLKHYQRISKKNAMCTYAEYIGLERIDKAFSKKEKRHGIASRRQLIANFHKRHLLEKNKVFTNFLPCYIYHMCLNPQPQLVG